MDVFTWFVSFLVLVCSIYWYFKRKFSYWKDVGIAFVPGIPVLGSLYSAPWKPAHDADVERYKKYGRLHGYYEGNRPALTVADPDLLRDILVKEFQFFTSRRDLTTGNEIADDMVSILQGEKWKRVRTLITPAFTTGKIKRMTSLILDSAKTLCENFEMHVQKSQPINAKSLFGAFTMDVIASTAFGTKVDSHNDPNNKFVVTAKQIFSRNVPLRFLLFFFFPSISKAFRISIFSPKALKFFKDATLRIIEERKKTGQVRNDFLQMLMDCAIEQKSTKDETEEREVENGIDIKLTKDQRELSENEILGQCVLFFLAGYETTASTLSFACYLLALNPECQERLIEEIDAALKNNEGQVTYETVQSLKYLDCVISETLRIFPPAIRLERMADEDHELGHTGVTVPKGMIVGIPVYAMHHDPEFYPDPEKFDPDRFTAEAKAERNPYTYLPFGAGPRNCVGMRFALMEIKICLTLLFSKFRVKRCAQTKVPLEYYMGQGVLQPKEILLGVEERTDKI